MGKVLLQLIGAFFGTLGFCILLNIPKKLWVYSSLVGTAAWGVYLAAGHFTDAVATANFLAALTAAVISQILARCFRAPVTLFLMPGILPMVPGAGMYEIAYSAVQGDQALVNHYIMQTLQIAGSIAVGIFLADIVQRVIRPKSITKN